MGSYGMCYMQYWSALLFVTLNDLDCLVWWLTCCCVHCAGDYIYWTDWHRRTVERVDKLTGKQRSIIVDQLPDVMGLTAVNMSAPTGLHMPLFAVVHRLTQKQPHYHHLFSRNEINIHNDAHKNDNCAQRFYILIKPFLCKLSVYCHDHYRCGYRYFSFWLLLVHNLQLACCFLWCDVAVF